MLGLFILNFLSDKYKNFLMKIKMAGSFFFFSTQFTWSRLNSKQQNSTYVPEQYKIPKVFPAVKLK